MLKVKNHRGRKAPQGHLTEYTAYHGDTQRRKRFPQWGQRENEGDFFPPLLNNLREKLL